MFITSYSGGIKGLTAIGTVQSLIMHFTLPVFHPSICLFFHAVMLLSFSFRCCVFFLCDLEEEITVQANENVAVRPAQPSVLLMCLCIYVQC